MYRECGVVTETEVVFCCAELEGLGRAGGGGDVIETQLKLGSQKWKAKCRVSRHEQNWQDEDVGGVWVWSSLCDGLCVVV